MCQFVIGNGLSLGWGGLRRPIRDAVTGPGCSLVGSRTDRPKRLIHLARWEEAHGTFLFLSKNERSFDFR
jgi:hypothetical protein